METIFGKYDAIVAGAGLWGCTIARTLSEKGKRVLVMEKRDVIGGNCRCQTIEGIEVHCHGSHIFHTSNDLVWKFVNRFSNFNCYCHKVLARHNDKTYFLPIGLALINKFFNLELNPSQANEFMKDEKNSKAIFDVFFRNYTLKQWGTPSSEVDQSIIKRVVSRNSYDVNYFNDRWQGIPIDGYNAIFDKMLDHSNIDVLLNTPFSINMAKDFCGKVFYSGPIDALFDYQFGALPWRTLRFEIEELPISDYQGTSVINYSDAEIPYTRIHEFKHYHPEQKEVFLSNKTVIMREYSDSWKLGDEPYYAIISNKNESLLEKYKELAKSFPNLIVGGRLGEYKYLDMDKAIESALLASEIR